MQIIFLHGAWSSPKAFNYIVQNLNLTSNYSLLEYDTSAEFYQNLSVLFDKIKNYESVFFVGHSLGGVYALHLADILENKCRGAVTIATPYGGLATSMMFRFVYPKEPVFKYLDPMSKVVWYNNAAKRPSNWTQIVCKSSRVPWIREDNDGVVTVPSQTWISDMKMKFFNNGHHDILQEPEVVKLIKEKINISD